MQQQQTRADFDLVRRVRDMTRAYILRRTDERSPIPWDAFKDNLTIDANGRRHVQVPPPYHDAREKICADAFYALRACRTREDFIEYFAGTLCSVPQFLPDGEYRGLTSVLLDRGDAWQDARALAMLTVSSLWSAD